MIRLLSTTWLLIMGAGFIWGTTQFDNGWTIFVMVIGAIASFASFAVAIDPLRNPRG